MKRTQLYLQENIWKTLHIRSRQQGTSISELVRQAVREKYGSSPAGRREAMEGLVGLRKNRRDLPDTATYLRRLRKGKRLRRIYS
jgi:Ribbon-helix-helix protein, copG family